MNHQIKAIIWKNVQATKWNDIAKEAFVPLISVLILFAANHNYEIGNIFLLLMLPIYIPSSFVGLQRQLLVEYVSEKSNKIRDIYRIMGMKLINYRIAWYLTYYAKSLLVFLILFLAIIFTQTLSLGDFVLIFLSFLIFILACISQTLFMSSFFNDAHLASEFGSFCLTIFALVYFLRYVSQHWIIYLVIALFPQSVFSLILMSFIEKTPIDVNYLTLNFSLLLNAAIYTAFYVYLEGVFDLHNPQPWCRYPWGNFLGNSRQASKVQYIEMVEKQSLTQENDSEEPYGTINILALNKYYGENHAVRDLNLKIFPRQIICILGQNGAGKTTTLNILTGLTKKSSGSIHIMGRDMDSEDFSNLIGYCTQESILYGDLTTIQNLMFQGMLRGLTGVNLAMECQRVVEQLQLTGFENTQASMLSGGNRRKVQLGVSLMANSQIIFLDEPTASLDPISRRQIWDILLELKRQDKTLILTTHFMDEAEYLANKIAILKQGKLVIYGTSAHIKKQLEVGYTLEISGNKAEEIELRDSKLISKGSDQTRFQLLSPDIFKYTKVIEELEQQGYLVRLTDNTLEDAYLKLNKEESEVQIPIDQQKQVFQMAFTGKSYQLFLIQVYALLLKKYFCTIRSFSLMIMIILPLAFLLGGALIGPHFLDQMEKEMLKLKLFFVSMFIMQSFSLNSSIFINTPLQDRELKIRQQLKQLNVSPLAYFFSTYIGDYVVVLFNALCIYLILSLKQMSFFEQCKEMTIKFILYFGAAVLPYSYTASFIFSTTKSAYKIFPVLNFMVLYSLPQLLSDLLLKNPQLEIYMAYISPFFALDRCFNKMMDENESYNPYLTALQVQMLIYSAAYLLLEQNLVLFTNNQPYQNIHNQLEMHKLKHVYPKMKNEALNIQTFSLQKQTIMGVLGPNGAGKSTLIQLITDCIKLQEGIVSYRDGISISACQQAEGLWDELKPGEALLIFGLLKGGTSGIIYESFEIMSALQLNNLGKIKELSGGQKRKVALAITLIGRDNILVLDEPSNGLDPISRHNLQNLIREHVSKNGSSIILTTHDMDEAQKLSDQITIVIKGKVVVSDTCSELINKIGSGIQLHLQTEQTADAFRDLEFDSFKKEEHELILQMGKKLSIGPTLRLMDEYQNRGLIRDFSIQEANIEQVFIQLTRLQFAD